MVGIFSFLPSNHLRVRRAYTRCALIVLLMAPLVFILSASGGSGQPRTYTVSEAPDPNGLVYEGSNYGGWWYDANNIDANSVVYSFGLGEDTSWDEALLRRGAHVFGFDPTPKSLEYVRRREELKRGPGRFTLIPEGLWTSDTILKFTLPDDPKHVSLRAGEHQGKQGSIELKVNTLEHFMNVNKHSRLDILKIDVEGAEYEFLEDLLTKDFFPFDQLLVEFHHRFFEAGKDIQNDLFLKMFLRGFAVARNENNQEVTFRKVFRTNK